MCFGSPLLFFHKLQMVPSPLKISFFGFVPIRRGSSFSLRNDRDSTDQIRLNMAPLYFMPAGCLFSSGPVSSLPKDLLMFCRRKRSSLNNTVEAFLFVFSHII